MSEAVKAAQHEEAPSMGPVPWEMADKVEQQILAMNAALMRRCCLGTHDSTLDTGKLPHLWARCGQLSRCNSQP